MSEIKRVTLTTLEPQKVSDKVNKKQFKTVRISVCLPESNEDNCPEYNYKDQLAAVKKKSKQVRDTNSVENGLDSFENDDDVKRIALEMEAKYGTGMTGGSGNKRKRKGRKDDYADIGMGYDESDSFIDNTDGYDEIIPQNVTTLHGGFYINCGALEFKTDDEASSASSSSSSSESSDQEGQDGDGTDDEDRPKKSKKRILDSSSSDSESVHTSQAEKKLKLQTVKTTMHQAIKRKMFSAGKIQVKKKSPIDPLKKTVKDLLREKREDLDMSIPTELKEIDENVEKDSLKENKKPMSITSVTDAIESVVKQVVDEVSYDKNQNRQSLDVNTADLSVNKNETVNSQSVSVNLESSQDISKTQRPEITKLPENLPLDIIEIVDLIKVAGINYKGEGKKAFFTDEVNSLLLSLERKCRVLGKSSRLRVYEFLSSFVVVCKKDTLMKRARSLILDQEESRLKKLEVELKDKIDFVMPSLIAKFELECQNTLAKKFSKESAESEELKTLKMPRKKFPWTDEARKLIKDILSFKKRCLIREGKQKDKLEEQVVGYLKTVILPLWPEGWMYLNNLKKVYNSMASDNSRSANSSLHSSSLQVVGATPTSNSEVKAHLQSISGEVSVHSVKPQAEAPKEKPVDVFKTYPEKHAKQAERGALLAEKHSSQADKASPPPEKHPPAAAEPPRRPRPPPDGAARAATPGSPKHPKRPDGPSDLSAKTPKPPDGLLGAAPSGWGGRGSKDFSQFEMFKPYADAGPFPNHRAKEKGRGSGEGVASAGKGREGRGEASSVKSAHRLLDIPAIFEDTTFTMKSAQDPKPDPAPSNPKPAPCLGLDLSDRPRHLPARSPDLFCPLQQASSTPKISKSEGDDIQMVMENLRALQKLSRSPVKSDTSAGGSPVSVIAFGKGGSAKGEELSPAGYQDEFQRQISSLQQMQGAGAPKPSCNNRCS